MSVSFGGIGEYAATFSNNATTAAAAGKPAKMSGSGEVTVCANGNRFIGVCVSSEGGHAAVQLRGHVTIKYSGTAPTPGWARLLADASGGVKLDSGTTGGEYLVTDVDSTAATVGFFL